MRPILLLAALTIASSVTACGTSSELPQAPPPALQAAQSRVDQALDCPQPPARLLQCQDGSLPAETPLADGTVRYSCSVPPSVADAIGNAPITVVMGALAGLWQKEVDLRFQGQRWDGQCRIGTPAPTK